MSTELVKQPSTMELIQQTLVASKESGLSAQETAIIIKELVALRQSEERFAWEREERQSQKDFDDALARCQKQIEVVLPDSEASNRVWASFRRLNETVRPLYVAEGFAISFTEEPAVVSGRVRLAAIVSRTGIRRTFYKEMTPVTVGAQGKQVMNLTDAEASIESRIKRYLIKDIFNIVVGTDADELQGLTVEQGEELQAMIEQMKNSETLEDGREAYKRAYKLARDMKNNDATLKVIDLWEKCQQEFARSK